MKEIILPACRDARCPTCTHPRIVEAANRAVRKSKYHSPIRKDVQKLPEEYRMTSAPFGSKRL